MSLRRLFAFVEVKTRNGDVSPATTKEVELTGRATTSTLQSYPRETSGNPSHQFTGNNHKSFQEGRMTHEEHRSFWFMEVL